MTTRRIPQRDVNMANRLMVQAEICIRASKNLTAGDSINLKQVEESLYDSASQLREHQRKVSIIEVKGQRA